jgi:prepilin-type N-terminal cleavage/methylation domain-containing protein/prepilin-type processing-associated H-X9-DG protein
MSPRRKRRGFTLIELLGVISLLGILVGLLLPAVNSAREAGRRIQCANNMRNIGLGLVNFSTSKNSFPSSGTFIEPAPTPGTPSLFSSSLTYQSFGSQSTAAPSWGYSWVVDILPYIDAQDMYNAWDKQAPFWATPTQNQMNNSSPGNAQIGNTSIGILRCPDDYTAQPGLGNLSYVVNSGFSLALDATVGFNVPAPTAQTVGSYITTTYDWSLPQGGNPHGNLQRMGVMFPGTTLGNLPWDYKTTPAAVYDGMSNTVLVSENVLAGSSPANPLASNPNNGPTNWACPLPTFVAFIGSPSVCCPSGQCSPGSPTYTCTAANLNESTTPQPIPNGWVNASNQQAGTYDYINYGQNLGNEGYFPFSNSAHPGGCNMTFCDGAVRFIPSTINGAVYAKILTPAGGRLPQAFRQLPVSTDDFAQ